MKGARLEVVPGVAHMVNMEKPDDFNRMPLDFLRSLHYVINYKSRLLAALMDVEPQSKARLS